MIQHQQITIHTDGGARGNPGPAAIGIDAAADNESLFQHSEYLGEQTNNVAEYTGVIRALEKLQLLDVSSSKLIFVLDSELIVKQIQGLYKVKDSKLQSLHQQVFDLLSKLKNKHHLITFTNVPRAANKVADRLVNQALDSAK